MFDRTPPISKIFEAYSRKGGRIELDNPLAYALATIASVVATALCAMVSLTPGLIIAVLASIILTMKTITATYDFSDISNDKDHAENKKNMKSLPSSFLALVIEVAVFAPLLATYMSAQMLGEPFDITASFHFVAVLCLLFALAALVVACISERDWSLDIILFGVSAVLFGISSNGDLSLLIGMTSILVTSILALGACKTVAAVAYDLSEQDNTEQNEEKTCGWKSATNAAAEKTAEATTVENNIPSEKTHATDAQSEEENDLPSTGDRRAVITGLILMLFALFTPGTLRLAFAIASACIFIKVASSYGAKTENKDENITESSSDSTETASASVSESKREEHFAEVEPNIGKECSPETPSEQHQQWEKLMSTGKVIGAIGAAIFGVIAFALFTYEMAGTPIEDDIFGWGIIIGIIVCLAGIGLWGSAEDHIERAQWAKLEEELADTVEDSDQETPIEAECADNDNAPRKRRNDWMSAAGILMLLATPLLFFLTYSLPFSLLVFASGCTLILAAAWDEGGWNQKANKDLDAGVVDEPTESVYNIEDHLEDLISDENTENKSRDMFSRVARQIREASAKEGFALDASSTLIPEEQQLVEDAIVNLVDQVWKNAHIIANSATETKDGTIQICGESGIEALLDANDELVEVLDKMAQKLVQDQVEGALEQSHDAKRQAEEALDQISKIGF